MYQGIQSRKKNMSFYFIWYLETIAYTVYEYQEKMATIIFAIFNFSYSQFFIFLRKLSILNDENDHIMIETPDNYEEDMEDNLPGPAPPAGLPFDLEKL